MSDMITVTIDGIECTCEKGEYIYDVAKRNGIKIPTLCRHDAFEDHRACCRICIVEVEQRGRTKVVTSCVYPIDGECEVLTQSDRIKEERTVLYYSPVLAGGTASAPFLKSVTIDEKATKAVTKTETQEGNVTVITWTYDYNGYQFCLDVYVDAVQTHNVADAKTSAWGVNK